MRYEKMQTLPVGGFDDRIEDGGVHVYPNESDQTRVLETETYFFRWMKLLVFDGEGKLFEAGGGLYANDDRTKGSPQLTVSVPAGGFLLAFGQDAPAFLQECHENAMHGGMLYNATMIVLCDAIGSYDRNAKTVTVAYRPQPEPAENAEKYLFIGNSTTYFNGTPFLFKGMCEAAGVPVDVTYCTFGSAYLSEFADETHERGKALRALLQRKRFDYAVLHDAGSPLYTESKKQLDVLLPLLKENGAKPLLYMRYGAHRTPEGKRADAVRHHYTYETLGRAYGFPVAPVADAFIRCTDRYPEIDLFADDRQHHSREGAYLIACCMLEAFCGISPVGNSFTAHLPETVVTRLQQCAHDTVTNPTVSQAYKAVLFDLDGTVLDTLADLTAAINHALQTQKLPPRTPQEVCSFVGNGIRKLAERAAGIPLTGEQLDALLDAFRSFYGEHCADQTRPYDGIPELLHALKQRGIKTALVSNKADFATQKLCRIFFPGLLDFVAGEGGDIPRKPSPIGVQKALEALDVQPGEAVYIGDSGVDISTAANVGMSCISVTWGFRGEEVLLASGAERIVHTVKELEETLQ